MKCFKKRLLQPKKVHSLYLCISAPKSEMAVSKFVRSDLANKRDSLLLERVTFEQGKRMSFQLVRLPAKQFGFPSRLHAKAIYVQHKLKRSPYSEFFFPIQAGLVLTSQSSSASCLVLPLLNLNRVFPKKAERAEWSKGELQKIRLALGRIHNLARFFQAFFEDKYEALGGENAKKSN